MKESSPKQIRNVGNLDPCVLMKSLCLDVAVLRGSDKIEEGSGCPNPLPAMEKTSGYGLSHKQLYTCTTARHVIPTSNKVVINDVLSCR